MASSFRIARGFLLAAFVLTVAVPLRSDEETERLIAQARAAAREDRNAQSSELFRQAIERSPARRLELLREYADQLTYSGRAAEAIPLYRETLARAPLSAEDRLRARLGFALALSWSGQLEASLREYEAIAETRPGMLEAQLGRARVLSWLDRHDLAAAEYQAILRAHPDNREAQKSLARVRAWQGRHRLAAQLLREYLARYPDDEEALIILLQARHWMGRSDIDKSALDRLVAASPRREEAASLLREVRERERDETRISGSASSQSDDLEIVTAALEHDLRFAFRRAIVGARYHRFSFERDRESAEINRPGMFVQYRISDALQWTASGFREEIETTSAAYGLTTYDTFLTIWPNDRFRFDFGANRSTFDNLRSLERRISARFLTASADFLPTERARLTVRANRGSYSDGNQRLMGQIEFERAVTMRPRILLGVRYTRFDFDRQLDNGYFNPGEFQSIVGTFHAWGSVGADFSWDVEWNLGWEVVDDDGKEAGSGGVRLTYPATRPLALELRLHAFDSRIETSSGFARRTASLSLRYRW